MNDVFGPVFCTYFCIFFVFFFVQNYNLRVGFRRSSPLSKVDNTENMCIKWMYISNLPREVLWLLIWMRDICLIAFFFRSLFSPKLQVFLRPIGARSTDRLLWTLKRSRDNPSPSFFSLHMNFSTSSLYSVVFVVAFVFSDCLACRGLRFTRKPAKCRICCKQGYLLPCLLYSTHDSFSIVVFDANSCNLHLFSKLFSHKDYTGCQVTDWSVSSTSAGYIAATQSSSKIFKHDEPIEKPDSTFHTFRANFPEFLFEVFFFAFFRKSFFSKPTGYVPVFICWIKSPNLLYFEEKQDSRFTPLRLETLFVLPMFQSYFFVFFVRVVFFLKG